MAHFYLNEALTTAVPGAEVLLVGAEARHAVAVSRTRVGDILHLGNGAGLMLTGQVTSAANDRVSVRVDTVRYDEPPQPRIHLFQALAKGDRDEAAVQTATELGVDSVTPWAAERSIVKWVGPKEVKGRQRWQTIVREASKQSVRSRVPEVHPVAGTAGIADRARTDRVLLLEPTAHTPLTSLSFDARDIIVVVGPEGGISETERTRLIAAGAEEVRLGPTVLRTSTAGPAALAVIAGLLGRW